MDYFEKFIILIVVGGPLIMCLYAIKKEAERDQR